MLSSAHFDPPNLSCVILDGFFSFLVDIDDGFVKVPVFCFRTLSACSSWAIRSVPDLIQDGQLPIKGITTTGFVFFFFFRSIVY